MAEIKPIPNSFCELQDFIDGQLILLDKPLEWTSFDVVNKVRGMLRRALGVKKIKVGHAGTLDPLASGLLVICTGKMTKQIQYLQAEDKAYEALIHLGEYTASLDRELEVEERAPIDHVTEEAVLKTAASFVGTYDQIPPIYSAKKVDGKRAYKVARKGNDVEMKPVSITISVCDVLDYSPPKVRVNVACQKGTYIRSLARDFGERLDTVACLDGLRRTRSGDFTIEEAMTLDDFSQRLNALQPPAGS